MPVSSGTGAKSVDRRAGKGVAPLRKTQWRSILSECGLGTLLAGSVIDCGSLKNSRMEMSFQLQMEQMPGYLAARFIGVGIPGEASRQFESIAEYCKRARDDKLLRERFQLVSFDPINFSSIRNGERLESTMSSTRR
jgi:hypothetical protein